MVSLNSLKMYVKGYKKVNLKDTKGVLNSTNNHKWVKTSKKAQTSRMVQTTVLPSGTKVQIYPHFETDTFKLVTKANGKSYGSYNRGEAPLASPVKKNDSFR